MGRREAHIRELAAELGVGVDLRPTGYYPEPNGWAQRGLIEVEGWDEDDQRAYFAGLHELGHIAFEHWRFPLSHYDPAKVEREAQTWRWALEHARETPDERTLATIETHWLGSYVEALGTSAVGENFHALGTQLRSSAGVPHVALAAS